MKKYLVSLTAFLFVLLAALPVWAAEPAKPNLTLNDAIARALANSEAVNKAALEVDRTKTVRDDTAENLHFTPMTPPGDPNIEKAWANILSADLTWRMSYKSLTAQQDSVVLGSCKKYWDIQQAIVTLGADKVAMKQADQDIQKARALQRVGMLANADLQAAVAKYTSAKAALDKAQNDLETAYTAFNQVVGLMPVDRPVLTDELKFTPLDKDLNLDTAVNHALENSPSVWLAEQKVDIQKYAADSMFFTGQYLPYEARQDAVTQAVSDAVSAKEAAEILTRNLYYSLRSLEDNYPAAQQAVKLAEENLRVANVKYQVGMITRAELAAADSSLAQAKQSLTQIEVTHAYNRLAFEKPWAYSSGS